MSANGVHESKPIHDGRNRRRKYLIKPAFQVKYAVTISLVVFFLSSFMGSALYGILHHQARMRAMNPMGYVAQIPLVVFISALAFAAVTAAGVGVWSIIVTHRICGPLHVMEGFLLDLANGRSPALRPLRQKDEFKDFYEHFSRAVSFLEARRKSELAMLAEALRIARTAPAAEEESCRKTMDAIAASVDTLQSEIADAVGRPSRHKSRAHQPSDAIS